MDNNKLKNINFSVFDLSSPTAIKLSLWQLISKPFKLFLTNWQIFLLTAIPTAILLTAVSLSFGRNILCSFPDISLTTNKCRETAFAFYGDTTIRLIISMIFAAKWYQFALQKQNFSLKNILRLHKGTFKAFGYFALFMIINFSPLLASAILFMHDPYPDWRKELLFFTSVAWIFLLPLLAIRFYSVIAFSLENNGNYTFKMIWKATSGNMLKLLLGTGIIVFLALFIFMQYYGNIQTITDNSLTAAAMYEFEYDLLITFFITLCINYCQTQKDLLFKENKHE